MLEVQKQLVLIWSSYLNHSLMKTHLQDNGIKLHPKKNRKFLDSIGQFQVKNEAKLDDIKSVFMTSYTLQNC